MSKQNIPKWFKGDIYPEGNEVTNPFSGESYELNAIELSMYDFIMGATIMLETGDIFSNNSSKIQKELRKGLDWFRKNNINAYMILLD